MHQEEEILYVSILLSPKVGGQADVLKDGISWICFDAFSKYIHC
jgi:hypothetical protein